MKTEKPNPLGSSTILELADEYAAATATFARAIALKDEADSMSPIAREAEDKRAVLAEALDTAQPALSGCACRWDAEDNRIATCTRHQGWLDVVQEWADRAKVAVPPSQAQPPAPSDTAITYMTGYSDCKEWAGATSQAGELNDAKRLDWIRDQLFEHKWNGVVGKGCAVQWVVAPDFRFKQRELTDDSGITAGDFRRAIDAAINAKEQLNG